MLSKNESEESPKRSGLSFVEDNDSDSDMDEEDVFVDAVTGLKVSERTDAMSGERSEPRSKARRETKRDEKRSDELILTASSIVTSR